MRNKIKILFFCDHYVFAFQMGSQILVLSWNFMWNRNKYDLILRTPFENVIRNKIRILSDMSRMLLAIFIERLISIISTNLKNTCCRTWPVGKSVLHTKTDWRKSNFKNDSKCQLIKKVLSKTQSCFIFGSKLWQ